MRHSCRQSWVFPAALVPANSLMPGTRKPPRRILSSDGQPVVSIPGSVRRKRGRGRSVWEREREKDKSGDHRKIK